MRTLQIAATALAFVLVLVLAGVFVTPVRTVIAEVLGDETSNNIVALFSTVTARPTDTRDIVALPHTGTSPYGINVFLQQEVEERKVRRTLEMVKEAGFHWVKQQVLWSEIEVPAKGQHWDEKFQKSTWEKYDRIVDIAREYGLELILRLDTSPQWTRPDSDKIETPPDNYDDYGDFVYTVVSRYRGKVKHYQVWNEPNIAYEWGEKPVNAADYVRLLQTAYRRAKQADPDSAIIIAALAPTIERSPQAVNDLVFIQQMYDAGAKAYFDIMSANPYGLRSGPDDRRLNGDEEVNFSRPVLVRELMVRNDDAGKPIWASELGWNVLPRDFPEKPVFGRVSRELQAKYTVRAYQRAQEEWPWMGVMNLWHFRMVNEADKQRQSYYFNVVDEDSRPYPVYDAMKAFANRPAVLPYGLHQESHWALHYFGTWVQEKDERAVLGAYVRSDGPATSLEFTFVGTDLELVAPVGPELGRASVRIDGKPSQWVQTDEEGHTYTNQRQDEPRFQVRFTLASGLQYGPHTVEVRPIEGSIAVDALIVNNRSKVFR